VLLNEGSMNDERWTIVDRVFESAPEREPHECRRPSSRPGTPESHAWTIRTGAALLVRGIGDQPPVPDLPAQDAKAGFQRVFRRFLGVFARPEHPLALFLDDLQWLDAVPLI
jgi:hypothetical protein